MLSHYGGADAVERCIYLGTPHVGSLQALQTMIAGGGFLPFGMALAKIRDLVLSLPSFYQLLPAHPGAELETGEPFLPLESEPDWLPPERRAYLEAAIEFGRLLQAPPAPVKSTCVFGYEQKTLESLRLRRGRNGTLDIVDQFYSRRGDGLVLEMSAVLEDADIHPVKQQHGVLYSDPDVLRRLRFELTERAG